MLHDHFTPIAPNDLSHCDIRKYVRSSGLVVCSSGQRRPRHTRKRAGTIPLTSSG